MNKFLIFILVGILITLSITIYFTSQYQEAISQDKTAFFVSILSSMWQDITFFLLVGVTAILAQFYQHKGEILRKRVHNLFSNDEVSYSTISYVENQIRDLSIYCSDAASILEVLEYSKSKKAYRVSFHNKYYLCNMFGDVPYESVIMANVAPDLIRDDIEVLGEISSISLTSEKGEKKDFLNGDHVIPSTGFSQPITVSLDKKGRAIYEMKWWSWVDQHGNSGFSMKRLAEKYQVSIENKSSLQVGFTTNENEPPEYIKFGEKRIISNRQDVPPNERTEFWWFPPKGLEEDIARREYKLHPILSSHRQGEKPLDPI
ncbi:hypothetical protein FJN13_14590 [Alteromonas mediterranea]|uniref:hypothetical protein n=1 Tax=Alteromonas mediterranea TaxID=314275 RepID=UPI0011302F1F|nr:hypothetical protein [Alteromonas mediterranea]QDG35962.1 hypothetical protein FJN13_14590 [Alteromonas mediterranea]